MRSGFLCTAVMISSFSLTEQGNLLIWLLVSAENPLVSDHQPDADGCRAQDGEEKAGGVLLEEEFPACQEMAAKAGTELCALKEGDHINIGGRFFEVLHVPGHTPGSLALLDRLNRILITGDLVSKMMPVFLFGEGRDYDAYLRTLQKLPNIMASL